MTGPSGLAARRAAAASQHGKHQPQCRLYVYGKHQDASFQMCKAAAAHLAANIEHLEATIEGFFETQYEQHLRYTVAQFGGSFSQSKPSQPLIYAETDNEVLYFPSDNKFLEWLGKRYAYEDNTQSMFYKDIGGKAVDSAKASSGRSYCAISISMNDLPKEIVQLELFDEESPMLAMNFLKLLTSPRFNGHSLHRVKEGCWIQGGDLVDGSGLHSEGADGGLVRNESYKIKHDLPGLLGMCSQGKDTVGSQFYITVKELPFLDGKFTVIGRVISGMRTIQVINELATKNERPLQDIKIFAEPEFTLFGACQKQS